MKIYNFGSDYAHQQALKNKSKQMAAKVTEAPKETSESNAGNQVQGRGEGDVASDADFQEGSKKNRKKKETGSEKGQPEDLPEV